jgi:heat shock protein HslJ
MYRPLRHVALAAALLGAITSTGCQLVSGTPSSLVGPTWQWTASQETAPARQTVTPDPENYTIAFLNDGTLNVKADCNSVAGTYAVGIPLDLTITLGPSTLAACGDESLDVVYLDLLSRVASYSTTSGQLNLDLADGAGAMQFRAAP